MEFKAGAVGCLICIIALIGSILIPAVLNGENVEVPVNEYEYITDLTGTFNTANAPEYIDYSPAANYVGYATQSVNYTASNTANTYRYVASYPNDVTISQTVDETTSLETSGQISFSPSYLITRVLLNYTGGTYNFGASSTYNTYSYNAYADSNNDPALYNPPAIFVTKLSEIIYSTFHDYPDSNGNVEITLTHNGNYPLLMGLRSSYSHITLSNGSDCIWYIYHTNISSYPTKIIWNVNSNIATVYNGSTVLFSGNASTDIDVYYKYYYNAGGTSTLAPINTELRTNNAIQRVTTVTSSSSYPNYNPQNTHDVYINNTESIGSLPTTPGGTTYGGHNYNMYLDYNSSNRGITSLASVLNSLNIDFAHLEEYTTVAVRVTNNNSEPVIFQYGPFTDISATADWTETSSANFPYTISYSSVDNVKIYYRPSGTTQTRLAYDGSPNNVYLIYKYYYGGANGHYASTSTTFTATYRIEASTSISNSTYFNQSQLSPFDTSNAGTLALLSWNGTYDMGVGGTYQGINYKIRANNYTVTPPRTPAYSLPDVWTLAHLLDILHITGYSSVDLSIDYDTDYPVLFYYGGFTQNDISVGGETQKVYSATLNENNSMPDRLYIVDDSVRAYKNNNLIYTAPLNSVYVINKYQVNGGSGFNTADTYAGLSGFGTTDVGAVSITVDNNSSYPSDAYNFSSPGGVSGVDPRYLLPYLDYTGTQFNNLGTDYENTSIGKNIQICLTSNTNNNFTTYNTRLSNILNAMNLSQYDSIDVDITYGAHPIIFMKGEWEYYSHSTRYHDQGGTVTTYYSYYWKEIGDNAFPDRMTYNKATQLAVFYKNGQQIWSAIASNVQVIYKYWILTDDLGPVAPTYTAVTDQSMTFNGIGKLHPAYGYANPTFGVTLKTGITTWKNGYENNVINILWAEKDRNTVNNLTIAADTSVISITRYPTNYISITVIKANGETTTTNFGNWHKGQITINVAAKTVSFTPISGQSLPNFTDDPIELSAATTTWEDWYVGGPISALTISTNATSMVFGVTGTTVFLNTYGVVMFDPSINIDDYFPELDNWRLNFYSFALVGDSLKINDVTYPVDKKNNTITIQDSVTGKNVTGTLNNVYISKDDGNLTFTFENEEKTVNLGETITDNIEFNGMWYFTTGLYEIEKGTETQWRWDIWSFNINIADSCLFFIGFIILFLIIGKGILKMDLGVIDWGILICGVFLSTIIAGGYYL